jgi:hypothetical protein
MNCREFQRLLPELMEGAGNAEQEGHVASCSPCSNLVSDLKAISSAARLLQGSEEPSARVWNALELALRQEGLIRQPQPSWASIFAPPRGWRVAWLAPAAAAVLIISGLILYRRSPVEEPRVAQSSAARLSSSGLPASAGAAGTVAFFTGVGNDDQQLLEEIGSRSAAMRAEYAANLQTVNAYIRDAEESAKEDPNDQEAQQSVMNAYEQRAMVYQMALDRSLP